MSVAIAELLSKTDVQVLWKFNKLGEFLDNPLAPLKPYLDNERVKMSDWLIADLPSLLETGDTVASVYHGGSNCFHETIS